VLLAEQGDYVVFHGLSHSWYAEETSVVVAIRWPSVPGYGAVQDGQDTNGLEPGLDRTHRRQISGAQRRRA
jgi:hypothetical protein